MVSVRVRGSRGRHRGCLCLACVVCTVGSCGCEFVETHGFVYSVGSDAHCLTEKGLGLHVLFRDDCERHSSTPCRSRSPFVTFLRVYAVSWSTSRDARNIMDDFGWFFSFSDLRLEGSRGAAHGACQFQQKSGGQGLSTEGFPSQRCGVCKRFPSGRRAMLDWVLERLLTAATLQLATGSRGRRNQFRQPPDTGVIQGSRETLLCEQVSRSSSTRKVVVFQLFSADPPGLEVMGRRCYGVSVITLEINFFPIPSHEWRCLLTYKLMPPWSTTPVTLFT